MLRPSWAEVDLDALAANLAHLRAVAGGARVMGVVKADAYGHGAPQVGRALAAAGVDWLGVAMAEEGIELRAAGVEVPILVLGPVNEEQRALLVSQRLTPAVVSLDQLAAWDAHCRATGRPQEVHLKVDTGMHRLGIELEAVGQALAMLRAQPLLRLGGVASHLADSDDLDSPRNEAQAERFAEVLALLTTEERARALIHLANSGGTLHWPSTRHGLVRCGLALYGHDPARHDPARHDPGLRPVLSVHARVAQVRELLPGERVGYNGRWQAAAASRVGVVQVGYADGYAWRLANRGEVLVRGQRAPVVGAVSMDLLTVDLTATSAVLGDQVVLLGRQGGEEVTVWELAERAGTTPYEVITRFGQRLARRYLRGGGVVATCSRHLGEVQVG